MNDKQESEISYKKLDKILKTNLDKFNIQITPDFSKKAFLFWQELVFWNKTHNLTAITDFYDAALFHFVDSLLPATEKNLFFDGAKVLDLGSGAGFPGIPLSLLFPKVSFFLLDKNRKKTSFISLTAANLAFNNVTAVNEPFLSHMQKYSLIVSRAVKIDREKFLHCKNLINKNGYLAIFYSSKQEVFQDESLDRIKFYDLEKGSRKIAFYQF